MVETLGLLDLAGLKDRPLFLGVVFVERDREC